MAKKLPRKEKKQEKTEEEKIDVAEKTAEKDVKVVEEASEKKVEVARKPRNRIQEENQWVPRTRLGKDVMEGKITSMDEIFEKGLKISEAEIVDALLPGLNHEIILVGGTTGKGGGIRRTAFRRTTRMHKSGRRFRMSVMVVVGNNNGYVGLGLATGPPGKQRDVIRKGLNRAKLNIIPIRRGCGSWECKCGGMHSIPFSVTGKTGSVRMTLLPAPKGVGLTVSNEVKKIMRLVGLNDIWTKTRGKTQSRINMVKALFDAFKKLDRFRVQAYDVEVKEGSI